MGALDEIQDPLEACFRLTRWVFSCLLIRFSRTSPALGGGALQESMASTMSSSHTWAGHKNDVFDVLTLHREKKKHKI
jgi:hypothetical protein